MITRTNAFKTSDNRTFETLEQAQQNEIELLLGFKDEDLETVAQISNRIMEQRDKLADILTTKSTSKPRARKVNGGTKKRTPAADNAGINRALQDGKQ